MFAPRPTHDCPPYPGRVLGSRTPLWTPLASHTGHRLTLAGRAADEVECVVIHPDGSVGPDDERRELMDPNRALEGVVNAHRCEGPARSRLDGAHPPESRPTPSHPRHTEHD